MNAVSHSPHSSASPHNSSSSDITMTESHSSQILSLFPQHMWTRFQDNAIHITAQGQSLTLVKSSIASKCLLVTSLMKDLTYLPTGSTLWNLLKPSQRKNVQAFQRKKDDWKEKVLTRRVAQQRWQDASMSGIKLDSLFIPNIGACDLQLGKSSRAIQAGSRNHLLLHQAPAPPLGRSSVG